MRIIPIAALALLAACGETRADGGAASGEVLVFAAASLQDALQELGTAFEAQTGTRVVFNFAGSNDLAHQIRASRGADVFLSASEAWMDTVQAAGLLLPGTRRDLLANTLVIVASARDSSRMDGPCDLAALPVRHLALGDPDAVPAGTYAREWMRSVDCGGRTLWEAMRDRVAPTPDVRAALGLTLADPRVVAVVYQTDARAFPERTRVLHEVRGGPPIRYVMAQVARKDNPADAARFRGFLASELAADVFRRHGFTPLATGAP